MSSKAEKLHERNRNKQTKRFVLLMVNHPVCLEGMFHEWQDEFILEQAFVTMCRPPSFPSFSIYESNSKIHSRDRIPSCPLNQWSPSVPMFGLCPTYQQTSTEEQKLPLWWLERAHIPCSQAGDHEWQRNHTFHQHSSEFYITRAWREKPVRTQEAEAKRVEVAS